jgi:hypothetical protein
MLKSYFCKFANTEIAAGSCRRRGNGQTTLSRTM